LSPFASVGGTADIDGAFTTDIELPVDLSSTTGVRGSGFTFSGITDCGSCVDGAGTTNIFGTGSSAGGAGGAGGVIRGKTTVGSACLAGAVAGVNPVGARGVAGKGPDADDNGFGAAPGPIAPGRARLPVALVLLSSGSLIRAVSRESRPVGITNDFVSLPKSVPLDFTGVGVFASGVSNGL